MNVIRIISPHIDDAFLSLGGSIFNWIERGIKVKIYNIFTISNWTSPDSISGINHSLDVEWITALRKKEEEEVSKHVGFDYEFWDFLDLPLRGGFSESDVINMEQAITIKLNQCLNTEDYFFFPLGIGHLDHILIKKICMRLISEKYNIYYFEDMPHLSWGNYDYEDVYNTESKNKIPICEKIDFQNKLENLRRYNSQVTIGWLNNIKTYSYNLIDNEYYERYWQIKHEG